MEDSTLSIGQKNLIEAVKEKVNEKKLVKALKLSLAELYNIAAVLPYKNKAYDQYQQVVIQMDDGEEIIIQCDQASLNPFGVQLFDVFTDPTKEGRVAVLGVKNHNLMLYNNVTIISYPAIRNSYDLEHKQVGLGRFTRFGKYTDMKSFEQRAESVDRSLKNVYKNFVTYLLSNNREKINLVFDYFINNYNLDNWAFCFDPSFSCNENIRPKRVPLFYRLYEENASMFPYIMTLYEQLIAKEKLKFGIPISTLHHCAYHAFLQNNINAALLFLGDLKAKNFYGYDQNDFIEALAGKDDLIIELLLRDFFSPQDIANMRNMKETKYAKEDNVKAVLKVIDTYDLVLSSFVDDIAKKAIEIQNHCLEHSELVLKCLYALIINQVIEDNKDYNFKILKKFFVIFKQLFGARQLLNDILKHVYTLDFDVIKNKSLFKDNATKKKYFGKYFSKLTSMTGDNVQLVANIANDKSELITGQKEDDLKPIPEQSDQSALKNNPELLMALVAVEASLREASIPMVNGFATKTFLKLTISEMLNFPDIVKFFENIKIEAAGDLLAFVCHHLGYMQYAQLTQTLPEVVTENYCNQAVDNFLISVELGYKESYVFLAELIQRYYIEKKNLKVIIEKLLLLDPENIIKVFPDLSIYTKLLHVESDPELSKRLSYFLGRCHFIANDYKEAEKYLYEAASNGCKDSMRYFADHLDHLPLGTFIKASFHASFKAQKKMFSDQVWLLPNDPTELLSILKQLYAEYGERTEDTPQSRYLRTTLADLAQFYRSTKKPFNLLNDVSLVIKEHELDSSLPIQEALIDIWIGKEKSGINISVEEIEACKIIPLILKMAKYYLDQPEEIKQLKGLLLASKYFSDSDNTNRKAARQLYLDSNVEIQEKFNDAVILPNVKEIYVTHYQPGMDFHYQWKRDDGGARKLKYLESLDRVKKEYDYLSPKVVEKLLIKASEVWAEDNYSLVYKSKSARMLLEEILKLMHNLENTGDQEYFLIYDNRDNNQYRGTSHKYSNINRELKEMLEYFDKHYNQIPANEILDKFIEIAKNALEKKGGFSFFTSIPQHVRDFYQKIASISVPETNKIVAESKEEDENKYEYKR